MIQQVVDLLLGRRREITAELAEVTSALHALGVTLDDDDPVTATPPVSVTTRRVEPSVRLAALDLLLAEPVTIHMDTIVANLRPKYPDREDGKFRANVRSALYQLKESGDIVTCGRGLYRAAKWPINAESPAVGAGLSDLSDLLPEGGENTDGQGSHHDHRDDLAGRNGDRDHLGAPVGH